MDTITPTSPSEPSAPSAVARLQAATRRYGEVVALDGVDLELRRGEVVALLGPNGAGKTTAVGLLLGLLRPTAGRVEVFGAAPASLAVRQRVGALLQIAKVPETLTVREHLELTSAYYPRPLPLAESLRLAGLGGLEGRLFGRLSGGQKQRLLFALALCGDPELVFLDEPTASLDVEARRGLWACIGQLAARGTTVLLTTHYLEEAAALASRVVVLARGRVVADGTTREVAALAGARRIRCHTDLDAARVAGWEGVDRALRREGWLEVTTPQVEAVVRRLLAADAGLSDLEITPAGLEEALLQLTSETTLREAA